MASGCHIGHCSFEVFNILFSGTSFHPFKILVWFRVDFTKKAMAPHSSTLAWKIPWMEEPGRLQSMGSHRVGHD